MTQAVTLAQAGNSNGTFRNKIINGAMTINQRGTSYTSSGYSLDRWYLVILGSSTITQSSNAPASFSNSLLWTVNSASTPSNVSYYNGFCQFIEGYNVADFAFGTSSAKNVTLSFWVYANNTGTYPLTFNNASGSGGSSNTATRSYVTSYTVSSANTWQKITVTIPGDTAGSWANTSGAGFNIWFDAGSGSNYSTATTNAWQSGAYFYPAGCFNLQNTASATLAITGVQLETGTVPTAFELRSYSKELMMCQRYCYVQSGQAGDRAGFGYCGTATLYNLVVPLPVTMRATPTLSSCSPIQVNDNQAGYNSSAIAIGDQVTNTCVNLKLTSSGMTIGRGAQCYWSPSAGSMVLSAEL